MKSKAKEKRILSYDTVKKAVHGDEQAMLQVVHFFQPIIHSNALRPCIDEQGNYTFYVDRFVKGHIENGLLRANWDYQKYRNK